jgi:hypothetical protein
MHKNKPFSSSSDGSQQELELRNYDPLVTMQTYTMDVGHTYDTKAQTQWTYKLQCTYEL